MEVKGRFDLFNKSLNRVKNVLEQLIKVKRDPSGINSEEYRSIIESKYERSSLGSDIISENLLSNIDLIFISDSADIVLKTNSKEKPIIGSIDIDLNYI